MIKRPARYELFALLTLALPILFSQFAQTGITLVETIFAGHYPDNGISLAGVAIGVSIWLPTILFAQGILSILTPIIAQLNGGSKRDQIAHQVRQGLIIATLLSIGVMLFLYHADKIIALRSTEASPVDPEMMAMAVDFLRAILWGVPGFLYYLVYRFQCEGVSDTKPIMVIMILALLLNIPVNYILIYGQWGLPELGGVGCGVAAVIVFWFMFLAMKFYISRSSAHRDIISTPRTIWYDFNAIKTIFRLGLPLGFAYFFEVTLFAVIALLIAPLGANVVAAHQILFQIGSMTFSIPLALGIATSIRVGYLLGKRDFQAAQYTSYISLSAAILGAVLTAGLLLLFRHTLLLGFTHDQEIIDLALQLIFLLALYQLFDYLQVTLSNILRAYEETKSIFYITFFAYWVIGLPTGYALGLTSLFMPALGVYGFWIGINAGLCVAAILLYLRLHSVQRYALLNGRPRV